MQYVNLKNILTLLLGSGFGAYMFMCPLNSENGAFTTPLGIIVELLDKSITATAPWILIFFVCLSALGALLCKIKTPSFVKNIPMLKNNFCVDYIYLVTRFVAMVVTIAVTLKIGPEAVINEDVGGVMISLGITLVALAIALSFVLPFLTDTGMMEFTGVILRPVVRPLFRVPGRASLDLVASWLASSNTAVLITGSQYHTGFYSKREAATIMTNFSLVSIPFCMVVSESLKLDDKFLYLYTVVTIIGFLLAIIGCRIWPIGTIPDEYMGTKQLDEEVDEHSSLLKCAIEAALKRASAFSLKDALYAGFDMAVGIVLDIIPIVIAWGTVGTVVVNCTPIFQTLSYPMGLYMSLLGVENAFAIAPQTLVGFIDMFIPALITDTSLPEKTRFIVAGISLVQIIYLTEVGSIIVKADVGLKMKHLFVIFLERTIIALPMLVFAAKYL